MVSRGSGPSDDLCAKYEHYFEFKSMAWNTKPHAVSILPKELGLTIIFGVMKNTSIVSPSV